MTGLIACGGKLPVMFAENAAKRGEELVIIGVKGMADPKLKKLAKKYYEGNIFRLGAMMKTFRAEGVNKAGMLGRIEKVDLFRDFRPDLKTLRLVLSAKDRRDISLLKAMIGGFEKAGIKIIPVTEFLSEHIAKKGVCTRRKPSARELADIEFGIPIAKAIADLDVGQAIVVKNKNVLAVEAVERTNETLLRGGKLGGKGAVAIKTARTKQDMRMDVPGIGVETIETMIKGELSCIAIEAGKMLLIEKEKTVKLADKHGIVIIAV
ncbi:MAG: UDP-2,3-diacylglucosamine diphosphatase LpxI [Candidatus Firestonebacteria bacterium]